MSENKAIQGLFNPTESDSYFYSLLAKVELARFLRRSKHAEERGQEK